MPSMQLDPESEQIREVYAHFGLAIYLAQCLEQSIFQHLLFFDHLPRVLANYTNFESWTKDFDRYEAQELGQTMGKLIRRLREAGQPPDALEPLLEECLKNRNWLAHGYFSDRAIKFTISDGREQMIAELEILQERFHACAELLDEASLPAMRKLGFTDEMFAKVQAEMISDYAKRKSDTYPLRQDSCPLNPI